MVPGACLSQIVTNSHTSDTNKHPKNDQKRTHIGQKWQKEWRYHTFVKEWMKALDKKRILAPSDYFYNFSFPRYGRFKSKFLCERYSHCIFSSCSIELTKTRNTWGLQQCWRTPLHSSGVITLLHCLLHITFQPFKPFKRCGNTV